MKATYTGIFATIRGSYNPVLQHFPTDKLSPPAESFHTPGCGMGAAGQATLFGSVVDLGMESCWA